MKLARPTGMRWALLVALLAACLGSTSVVAQSRGVIHFQKFQTFFELLDQSGGLSAEFAASDGDLCAIDGISCQNGEVVSMCDQPSLSCQYLTHLASQGCIDHLQMFGEALVRTRCNLRRASINRAGLDSTHSRKRSVETAARVRIVPHRILLSCFFWSRADFVFIFSTSPTGPRSFRTTLNDRRDRYRLCTCYGHHSLQYYSG